MGTVLEWALLIIFVLLQYGEKIMDSEGSMAHYLTFQVNEQQSCGLVFAIINSSHSKTLPSLSRERVSFLVVLVILPVHQTTK